MYNTLGNQYDNSLVSNAFGFMRFPLNFQPYDSDADWVITGVPFDAATSGRPGSRLGPALSVRSQPTLRGKAAAGRGISICVSA